MATAALLFFAAFVPAALGSGNPPVTFANTNAIIINSGANPPTIATPYPSSIVVTGLTGQVIFNVTVTLSNLTHSFPSDIDALLVGPQGQMMFPMSEVGGAERYPVTNITLTLDDDATNILPLYAPLMSGTFQPNKLHPTNYFDLPSPAPAGNSNAPARLSVFNGGDPDGTWNLFVVQDSAVDSGIISNGWSLAISSGVLLNVRPVHSTNFVLTWTNTAAGYTLQVTTNLSPPLTWSNVLTIPGNISGYFTFTNPIVGGNGYYRLINTNSD